jgi:hypothetical protein
VTGYPLPVKAICALAHVIAGQRCQRSSLSQGHNFLPPNKNWPQAFLSRHPELKAMKVKALDANRHDHNIYHKVEDWFKLMGELLLLYGTQTFFQRTYITWIRRESF